jgi:hypothetical protein
LGLHILGIFSLFPWSLFNGSRANAHEDNEDDGAVDNDPNRMKPNSVKDREDDYHWDDECGEGDEQGFKGVHQWLYPSVSAIHCQGLLWCMNIPLDCMVVQGS